MKPLVMGRYPTARPAYPAIRPSHADFPGTAIASPQNKSRSRARRPLGEATAATISAGGCAGITPRARFAGMVNGRLIFSVAPGERSEDPGSISISAAALPGCGASGPRIALRASGATPEVAAPMSFSGPGPGTGAGECSETRGAIPSPLRKLKDQRHGSPDQVRRRQCGRRLLRVILARVHHRRSGPRLVQRFGVAYATVQVGFDACADEKREAGANMSGE